MNESQGAPFKALNVSTAGHLTSAGNRLLSQTTNKNGWPRENIHGSVRLGETSRMRALRANSRAEMMAGTKRELFEAKIDAGSPPILLRNPNANQFSSLPSCQSQLINHPTFACSSPP
jgi:hypothetical protein